MDFQVSMFPKQMKLGKGWLDTLAVTTLLSADTTVGIIPANKSHPLLESSHCQPERGGQEKIVLLCDSWIFPKELATQFL